MKRSISIDFTSEELALLEKRAKKNFMSIRELVADIIRRSMISYRKGGGKSTQKIDDALVGIFSRERRGRKSKPNKA